MANFTILTNNPMASEKYPECSRLYSHSVEGIFIVARNLVHTGAVLLNHPLSGSIKPNDSPYKSLVLSRGAGGLDYSSLQLIEGALIVLHGLVQKRRRYNDRVLEDFMVIDLDLLDSAVGALPAQYHRWSAHAAGREQAQTGKGNGYVGTV